MAFFEQLTGKKRKHSLDLSDTSSVGEDLGEWSGFGDELTPNVGVGTPVEETVSYVNTDKLYPSWGSEQNQGLVSFNPQLGDDLQLNYQQGVERQPTKPRHVDADKLIWTFEAPQGSSNSVWEDGDRPGYLKYLQASSSSSSVPPPASYAGTDTEKPHILLQWRRHFVKPGEQLRRYTDVKLPDKNTHRLYIPDTSRVTWHTRHDIDLLEYKQENGGKQFICDFSGGSFLQKRSA